METLCRTNDGTQTLLRRLLTDSKTLLLQRVFFFQLHSDQEADLSLNVSVLYSFISSLIDHFIWIGSELLQRQSSSVLLVRSGTSQVWDTETSSDLIFVFDRFHFNFSIHLFIQSEVLLRLTRTSAHIYFWRLELLIDYLPIDWLINCLIIDYLSLMLIVWC